MQIRETELLHTVGTLDQLAKICAQPVPQVVFSGRSNVGKSSLINAVIGRKSLARVSSTPGKTITINFYGAPSERGGFKHGAATEKIAAYLVDLPGYGYAKRSPAEKERFRTLTDGFFVGKGDRIKLVIQLIDMGVGPTADDEMMLAYLADKKIPHIIVATKSDKLNKTQRDTALCAIRANPAVREKTVIIPFSSKTNEGVSDVIKRLNDVT